MIYFYEFLKGAGLALTLFGAWYFFVASGYSLIDLCVGALPGLFLLIISVLLVENTQLRKRQNEKG